MNAGRLLNRRERALGKMPKLEESIKGSFVIMNRFCGKPNCRCQKGQKHRSIYLSQSQRGKTRMIYIPHHAVKKTKEYIKNYQKVKDILNTLSDINIKLLKKI
ncbi:MAG: hypothetical protein KJ706_05360 [Candidatus Omnitrophica bacterium]|nr:hypothetical protein [Candidatus Omnitrophota bacterium]